MRLLSSWYSARHVGDALAPLILVARKDPVLRRHLLFALRLPRIQREALLKTALGELRMRSEPIDADTVLSALATKEGVRTVLRYLERE